MELSRLQISLQGKAHPEYLHQKKRFDFDPEDHDHIYCAVCHRVDNLNIERTGEETNKMDAVEGYIVTGYRLEIVGICESCQKKEKAKEKGQ